MLEISTLVGVMEKSALDDVVLGATLTGGRGHSSLSSDARSPAGLLAMMI